MYYFLYYYYYHYYNFDVKYYKIGEIYFKFDLEFSEENKTLLKKVFSNKVKVIDSKTIFLSGQTKISIEFDEGSLKTRIKFWGNLATIIYIAIGEYGSFRQGIREIIFDINNISEYIINSTKREPTIGMKIIRIKKGYGIIGKINEILERIDRLENNINNMSKQEIKNELDLIKQEISNISVLLPEDVREEFINELPKDYKNNLPKPDEKKIKFFQKMYMLKPDDEIEFIKK